MTIASGPVNAAATSQRRRATYSRAFARAKVRLKTSQAPGIKGHRLGHFRLPDLAGLGYHPTLATADGADGLPAHAPYDRILATCAVPRVPQAWCKQTRENGLVLVDVKVHAVIGNLVLLRRDGDRLSGRFDTGAATFMQMRTPAFTNLNHGGARDNISTG